MSTIFPTWMLPYLRHPIFQGGGTSGGSGGAGGPVEKGTHVTVAATADAWTRDRAEVDGLHERGYRVWWERTRPNGTLAPIPELDGPEGRTTGDFVYPVLAGEDGA